MQSFVEPFIDPANQITVSLCLEGQGHITVGLCLIMVEALILLE